MSEIFIDLGVPYFCSNKDRENSRIWVRFRFPYNNFWIKMQFREIINCFYENFSRLSQFYFICTLFIFINKCNYILL